MCYFKNKTIPELNILTPEQGLGPSTWEVVPAERSVAVGPQGGQHEAEVAVRAAGHTPRVRSQPAATAVP